MALSPPVTVILPAHNAASTIAPAIASTLRQSYPDFELWVLENGSTDRTAEVARSFNDPRIKVFELGPVGFQGALQHGIENARSEWLARMDADDLMFSNRLNVQMEVAREHPEFVLIGTSYALLTPFGHIFERILNCPSREVDSLRLGSNRFFSNPSTIFKRRVALEVGCIESTFTMDDIPLWFRLLTRGKGWEIAEPLHVYRLRPNSLSQDMNFYLEQRRVREKYAPESLKHSLKREKLTSRWVDIASLELITGDQIAVRRAAEYLEKDGYVSAARLMRCRSNLGAGGYMYYKWRNRNYYRHRPDWEQLFASLLSGS